jgi:RNA polymerase sigma-70 factor (ECF subfamily)
MDQPVRGVPDRAAFERLIEEYADRIYNVTFRITADANDAEDAMQEAFENAFRGWESFRGEASPATWLYRIAVNAALTRVRARRPVEYLVELSTTGQIRDWSAEASELAERAELQDLRSSLNCVQPWFCETFTVSPRRRPPRRWSCPRPH